MPEERGERTCNRIIKIESVRFVRSDAPRSRTEVQRIRQSGSAGLGQLLQHRRHSYLREWVPIEAHARVLQLRHP